jgi:hypothetical protein
MTPEAEQGKSDPQDHSEYSRPKPGRPSTVYHARKDGTGCCRRLGNYHPYSR